MNDRRSWFRREARKIGRRLKAAEGGRAPRGSGPELGSRTTRYEVAERVRAIPCGGIGAMHRLAQKVGLVDALHTRLPILKRRRPYSEADHVLNIAYNVRVWGAPCSTTSRRDARTGVSRRGSEHARFPNPTTAGDFWLRRFDRGQSTR